MLYDLKVVSRNTNLNTKIEIKSNNMKTLNICIKYDDIKERKESYLIDNSEILWRNEVLKIIRNMKYK